MEENKDLIDKLRAYVSFKEEEIIYKKYSGKNISFSDVRDCLIGNGRILEEDFEKQIYVIAIEAGIANMNTAIIAIQRIDSNKLSILGYAKEGLIKQHTAEKAILKIMDQIKQIPDRDITPYPSGNDGF